MKLHKHQFKTSNIFNISINVKHQIFSKLASMNCFSNITPLHYPSPPDTSEVGKPITIATNVESVSCPSRSSKYLGAALWLNCGARGMRVWLPLHGSKEDLSSRRTLVTVKQNVYPLVVHHHEAAILGLF